MRPALLLIVAAWLLIVAAPARGAAVITEERPLGGRGIELTIETPSFTAPTRAQVFLPSGYDAEPRRRWPVAYYLAGTNHTERSFNDIYEGERLTEGFPAIFVAPRGDSGYWNDWYNGGAFGPPRYETFVVEELLPLIDERFRTTADRGGRALFGESMGGYGVLSLAARHPDRFAAASSLSGTVNTNLPANAAALSASSALQGAAPDAIHGPRAQNEIRWRGHNPWDLAENLRAVDVQVRSANGTPGAPELADPAALASCALEFAVHDASVSLHDRLDSLDIEHVFTDYGNACHTVATFQAEITDTLPVFERVFADPPASPRRFTHVAIESRFEVWGWTFAADPARPAEFLRVENAGRTGLALAGSGTTTVTTPPFFRGLRAVDVRPGDTVAPGPDGRLRLALDLGAAGGETVRRRVTFAPHARLRISGVRVRGSRLRVCARALGGRLKRAQVRAVGRGGRSVGERRTSFGRARRCRVLRIERPPAAVRIDGRDRFGHRVGARRSLSAPRTR